MKKLLTAAIEEITALEARIDELEDENELLRYKLELKQSDIDGLRDTEVGDLQKQLEEKERLYRLVIEAHAKVSADLTLREADVDFYKAELEKAKAEIARLSATESEGEDDDDF